MKSGFKKSLKIKDIEQFRLLLEKTESKDFDGHTEFSKLTPEEKLQWLSESAIFAVEAGITGKK
jgi:hypothetical protein